MIYNAFSLPFGECVSVIIAYVSAILVALSFHEFGHAFVAYKEGDKTAKALKRITLKPLNHIDPLGFICLLIFGFGWAKPVPVNSQNFKHRKWGEFFVSIAGVTINFILAFLFTGIYCLFYKFGYNFLFGGNIIGLALRYYFNFAIIINIGLGLFNLLPIYPLDGFRIIESFTGHNSNFSYVMRRYSFIIVLLLLVSGVIDYVFSYLCNGACDLLISFWSLIFGL
ncbi:MAG: site-2 protease family protein [Clostridia bacterium]|nr:site-2 protease family protein [Clostridia bacterium]